MSPSPSSKPPANKMHRPSGAQRGKKPKLGQNFLSDPGAARKIVDSLGNISSSLVVEIGPGRAAITALLAQSARKLIAIELDRRLSAELRLIYNATPNVEIIEADVLTVDFDTIIQGALHGITDRQPGREPSVKAKAVGNLPYYITSDILLRLFAYHRNFSELVIMVQKEVADRIAARPATRDYGMLTVTSQLFADVEKLFTLPPSAFSPPPKVHSTVLRLRIAPKAEQLGVDAVRFQEFLKLAFAQKRKTLLNNLKSNYDDSAVRGAIKSAGARPDARAEALSIEKLAAIHREL
jgi:16S rRNA (adenine1518-N6/adenine1519-N6)-dimethyltransferase